MSEYLSWETAEEVTFECEPGTLSLEKVKTLKDIGVTRVSLGVENFNDEILENNGRPISRPKSSALTIGFSKSASRKSTSI